jgi:hypothetical protein
MHVKIFVHVQVAFLRQELTLKEDQYEEQLKAERQLSAEQLRREKDKCTAEIGAQMSQVSTAPVIFLHVLSLHCICDCSSLQ